MEGFMHDPGQHLCVLDQIVMLRAGPGDAHRVGFLKRIRADHECGHLRGQHNDRH